MKVVHIVSGSLTKGAARGAYWLHKALINKGIESKIILNHHDNLNDNSVICTQNGILSKVISFFLVILDLVPSYVFLKKDKGLFSSGFFGTNFNRIKEFNDADIINIHWANLGFISVKRIGKIRKPIVWTIRDMWPITGGCHYALGCQKYETGCGKCPLLSLSFKYDLSYFINKNKLINFRKANITVVGIGNWISQQVKNSHVFRNFKNETIYNTVDFDEFKKIDKDVAKKALNLNDKFTILVGAQNTSDTYKGMSQFVDMIKLLHTLNKDFQLVSFGKYNRDFDSLPVDCTQLGFINDIKILSAVYSSADVFIAPSKMETFGKTIAESLYCGTPVVAFNTTGPTDIITHKKSGYLAEPYSVDDLANGVCWIMSLSHSERCSLSEYGHMNVSKKFSPSIIAEQYIDLYKKILEE